MQKPYNDTATMYKMMATPKENILIRVYIEDLEKRLKGLHEGHILIARGIYFQASVLAMINPQVSKDLLLLTKLPMAIAEGKVREWICSTHAILFKGDKVRLLQDVTRAEVYEECDLDCDEVLYSTGAILTVEETLLFVSRFKVGIGLVCTDGDTVHVFNLAHVQAI